MSRVLNRMISKYGDTVTVMPRTTEVDEMGNPTHTYVEIDEFNIPAIVYEARGWIENVEEIGIRDDIDYVLLIHAEYSGSISPFDQIRLSDGQEILIDTVTTRKLRRYVQFLEVLCRRNI